jgi:hypothetical protein
MGFGVSSAERLVCLVVDGVCLSAKAVPKESFGFECLKRPPGVFDGQDLPSIVQGASLVFRTQSNATAGESLSHAHPLLPKPSSPLILFSSTHLKMAIGYWDFAWK